MLRRVALIVLFVAVSPASVGASPSAGTSSKSEEISRLGWEFRSGQYKLPLSSSTLSLGPGFVMVRGDNARRMVYLSQGEDFPEVEAVLVDPRTASGVIFAYLDSGYVRVDDWARINKTRLLDRIRQVTAQSNRQKTRAGLPSVTIKGWVRAPTLDRKSNTVSWAIEAIDGNTPIVNAVTLKLGKSGFEKLTWIGKRDLYLAKKGLLDDIRSSLEFSPGRRYDDYSSGDPRADFGISTLVAAAAGARPALDAGNASGIRAVFGKFAASPWGFASLAGAGIVIVLTPLIVLRRRRRSLMRAR